MTGGHRHRGDMKIRAILFDGYGTLFEDAMVPLREVCDRIIQRNGLRMGREAFLEGWDRHFFPIIRGPFVTLREADIASLRLLFQELGISDSPEGHIDVLFDRFNAAPLYPEVGRTLADLNGRATGIVSNADAENIDGALAASGLEFQVVVTSEGVRCYKPASGIFREAIGLVGRAPEETLYVGDSQDDDIVGARQVGMPVAWLNREGRSLRPGIPSPDFEIRDLSELGEIVRAHAGT